MDTNNLYSSLSDYRAAACTLNNSLRKVQAKIVELEHQNQLLRDRLAQKDQELLLVRQGHAFAESCNQTLRSYLGDMSKQQEQIVQLIKKSRVVLSMPTRGPGGITTIGDPSPLVTSNAAVIRPTSDQGRVVSIGNKTIRTELTRTSSSPGRISSIGDNSTQAAETRSSPGPARIVTLGDKPPVVMAQATTTRPTPGPRPEEFQHKRRKLISSD